MELKSVRLEVPEGGNIIVGQTHFIKSVEDIYEAIVNTVRQPLIVLDGGLIVQNVNQTFFQVFKVKPEETLNRRIYELGNGQWDIPKLRTLLEDILPHNSNFQDFAVEHVFPRIGKKKMILNARRLTSDKNETRMILLAIEDVTE